MLKLLFMIIALPFTVLSDTSWSEPLTTCSDGTTYTVTQYFTLDGWLGAAVVAAAAHLLFRKTRLSKLEHVDAILAVVTLALFVVGPLAVGYSGEQMARFARAAGAIVTTHDLMSVKGAIGVVVFAGLFAYRLDVRAAAACVVAGVVLAAGLFVSFPASEAPKPEPLIMVGHGVCDSDSDSYGF